MVEIALIIGCVLTPVYRRLTRSTRLPGATFGQAVLASIATIGFVALAIVCLDEGAPLAATIALTASVLVNLDVEWVRRSAVVRVRARHASTVTPFQKAT